MLSLAFPDKSVLLKDTIWHLDGLDVAIEGQTTTPSDEEQGRRTVNGGFSGNGSQEKFHGSDAKPL